MGSLVDEEVVLLVERPPAGLAVVDLHRRPRALPRSTAASTGLGFDGWINGKHIVGVFFFFFLPLAVRTTSFVRSFLWRALAIDNNQLLSFSPSSSSSSNCLMTFETSGEIEIDPRDKWSIYVDVSVSEVMMIRRS